MLIVVPASDASLVCDFVRQEKVSLPVIEQPDHAFGPLFKTHMVLALLGDSSSGHEATRIVLRDGLDGIRWLTTTPDVAEGVGRPQATTNSSVEER